LASGCNHAFIANRSDFYFLYGFRKGDLRRQANGLTPVAFEDPGFRKGHDDTSMKKWTGYGTIIEFNGDMSTGRGP
jgi:hypothetical protein